MHVQNKHDAIQENKHKEKQTKQSFLNSSMSSPPLGICISPIEYLSPYTPIYSLEYTLPLFCQE